MIELLHFTLHLNNIHQHVFLSQVSPHKFNNSLVVNVGTGASTQPQCLYRHPGSFLPHERLWVQTVPSVWGVVASDMSRTIAPWCRAPGAEDTNKGSGPTAIEHRPGGAAVTSCQCRQWEGSKGSISGSGGQLNDVHIAAVPCPLMTRSHWTASARELIRLYHRDSWLQLELRLPDVLRVPDQQLK